MYLLNLTSPQYIVEKLLDINERGSFVPPATLAGDAQAKQRLKQDDELFNIARLVNCTWFAQVVFSDYFATILGLVRDGSSWNLNPFGVRVWPLCEAKILMAGRSKSENQTIPWWSVGKGTASAWKYVFLRSVVGFSPY